MTNPRYFINISYHPSHIDGQQLVWVGTASGSTQSIPTYSGDHYVASMPEIPISASGSSYTQSLTNLLNLVATIDNPGTPPLSSTTTW